MTKRTRRSWTASEKAKIVLELLREEKTLNEVAQFHEIHPKMLSQWKTQFLENSEPAFDQKRGLRNIKESLRESQKREDELHRQIGKLTAEVNWAKKNLSKLDLPAKRSLIRKNEEAVSVRNQCELMDLSRSSFYYEPEPPFDAEALEVMHRIDGIYTECPFYGHRSMRDELVGLGYEIGKDRVLKYMQIMGLAAIYPQKKTTVPNREHQVYPYLLGDIDITRPNQVWASDITYVRLVGGFCYLVVVMDWYSRCVLSWRVSNSLHDEFCVSALEEAIRKYGVPEIFNTDQGS